MSESGRSLSSDPTPSDERVLSLGRLCFCGQPQDRERVHRSNACTYWVGHADCLLCDEGHPPTDHNLGDS